MVRSSPETIPWVTVGPPPRPSGNPIARTLSPEPELGRATEKNGDEIRCEGRDDREIALGCGADHRARDGLRVTPVVEGDRERAGPPHDMVVRHDHPPAIDDDARRLTLASVEPDRLDVDDPRQDARDDVSGTRASRSRRRSRRRGRGRRDRRGRRHRRCALLRVTAAARNDQAERRYGDERGPFTVGAEPTASRKHRRRARTAPRSRAGRSSLPPFLLLPEPGSQVFVDRVESLLVLDLEELASRCLRDLPERYGSGGTGRTKPPRSMTPFGVPSATV